MEGEFYTEVDASVLNPGISPMVLISGDPNPPEGGGSVSLWYRWKYDTETGEGGFTGVSWYHGSQYDNISKHYPKYEDFINWLITVKPTKLDDVLGDWDETDKANFLLLHGHELSPAGCAGAV